MTKRIAIATALGVVVGVICVGARRTEIRHQGDRGRIRMGVLNRALIGFAIGISELRLH